MQGAWKTNGFYFQIIKLPKCLRLEVLKYVEETKSFVSRFLPVWLKSNFAPRADFIFAFNTPNAKFVIASLGQSVKGSTSADGQIFHAMPAVYYKSGKYPDFAAKAHCHQKTFRRWQVSVFCMSEGQRCLEKPSGLGSLLSKPFRISVGGNIGRCIEEEQVGLGGACRVK